MYLPRSDTPARAIVSEYLDVARTFVETAPRPTWSTPCSINSRAARRRGSLPDPYLALLLRLPFGCERVPQRDVFLVRDRARRDGLVDIEHRTRVRIERRPLRQS